ncbi:MAG: 5-formyltetrahydrofolate cyclo-ligase [Chloroflexota bacterium]
MTDDELSLLKTNLRKQCRTERAAFGEETRARASESICAQLGQWGIFQQSDSILTYMPIKGEADLTALLSRHPAKRWILPRIIPEENHRMVFHPYDSNRLVRHPFGMAEPAPDSPVVAADEIQLALVPGLAFDHNGWRLGYGGGYFDRFLGDFTGVSVGIVFQRLLLDDLPHGAHDVSVQWIATEEGICPSLSR